MNSATFFRVSQLESPNEENLFFFFFPLLLFSLTYSLQAALPCEQQLSMCDCKQDGNGALEDSCG